MRRLLAILLLSAPAAALSQSAAAGQIIINGGTSAVVNAAMCAVTNLDWNLKFTWHTQLENATTWPFTANGEYRIFTANADLGSTNPFCNTASSGAVVAGRITTDPAVLAATVQEVTTAQSGRASVFAATAGFDCSKNGTVHVCVLWYPAVNDPTPRGYAKGTLSLKVSAPGKPTVTSVSAGDKALYVKATTPADATTSEAAVTWRAKAVARDAALDAGTHYSSYLGVSSGEGDEAKIGGLVNGVEYDVTAYAYSVDDNESPPSDLAGPYTPVPSANAWEVYALSGGRESGGCQAGGAGLAALACASVLLRLRRRS